MRLKSPSMALMYARYLSSARAGATPTAADSKTQKSAASNRLAAGPAAAIRNSLVALVVPPPNWDTPPKMKSVMLRTEVPNRRATSE